MRLNNWSIAASYDTTPHLRRRGSHTAVITRKGTKTMTTITTKDDTQIYYKDRGTGPVVTFSHGWPLNADAWDGQMLFLVQHGYRCVALDRRGHGRSSQASAHNDIDGYADDLAAVIEALDLKEATLVGHSTGGGEVARYIGRHGTKRVRKAVLIAAVPPIMLRTPSNPEGLPIEVFDQIRAGVAGDRSQYYKELAMAFYGANRPGAKVSQGTLDQFWLWSMQAGAKNAYAAALLLLAHCGSTPTRVFDLSPAVLARRPSTRRRATWPIWLDKPSIAGYFDRTQMVTRGAGSRVSTTSSRYGAIRPPTSFSAPSWTTSRAGSAPTR
jgi:non-heme chloroperoxidase